MSDTAKRDKPWIFRTYAGHSSAAASNALYRTNLAKGQTGLSIAFDLPTQTGYDSDDALARGEVGKVGVPISHLGDMRTLLDGIPLDRMNTSMTINAPAAWLLALYVAVADEQGAARAQLQGTTQNDIIKDIWPAAHISFRQNQRSGSPPTRSPSRRRRCPNGIRSISARITCRKPAPMP
jgi:(2R)-ethylmalonyl-CoA mutase